MASNKSDGRGIRGRLTREAVNRSGYLPQGNLIFEVIDR